MKKVIIVAEGKAATIIGPSLLAINVGSNGGVQKDDHAHVRHSVTVIDPDTKAELGVFHQTRLRLRITSVHADFSVGEVTDQRPNDGLSAVLDVTRITRYKTITGIAGNADGGTVYIQPGEPVVVTRTVDAEDGEANS